MANSFKKRCVAVVVAVAALGFAWRAEAQTSYQFVQLSSLGGSDSVATGINSLGQVVGFSTSASNSSELIATVWNGLTPTALPSLGGVSDVAYGINDSGQIVGTSNSQAVLWSGSTVSALLPLSTSSSSGVARAINNAGQIVGTSNSTAAEWTSDGQVTALTSSYSLTRALAISPSGQVVGEAQSFGGLFDVAALNWSSASASPVELPTSSSTVHPFPLLGLNGTAAGGVNAAGTVVGIVNGQAAEWTNGVISMLPTQSIQQSQAYAINDAGQVVGAYLSSGAARPSAVTWNNGVPTYLNDFLTADEVSAGLTLVSANAINDSGVIVGEDFNTATGVTGAFELVPVPEPSAWAWLIPGLAILVRGARRPMKTSVAR